jgi:hypothetical protein
MRILTPWLSLPNSDYAKHHQKFSPCFSMGVSGGVFFTPSTTLGRWVDTAGTFTANLKLTPTLGIRENTFQLEY